MFQRDGTQKTHRQQTENKNWEKNPKHYHPLNTENFLIAIEIKDKILSGLNENKIEYDLSNSGKRHWVKLCYLTSNGISMLMVHVAEIFICTAKLQSFRLCIIKSPSSRLKSCYHGSHSCFCFSCYLDWPQSHNLLFLHIIAALL